MIMTLKHSKIVLLSIITVAVIGSTFGINEILAFDAEHEFDKSEMPYADVIQKIEEYEARNSETNFLKYSEKMLSEPELSALGPEWEVLSVDAASTVDPFEIIEFRVIARLLDNPENMRNCEFPTEAVFVYDAKTGELLEKQIPEVNDCQQEVLPLSRQPSSADIPDWIQFAEASATRAYLVSEQGNDEDQHGGFGWINIPSLDESAPTTIYTEMDEQIYFGYNQVINGEFFQVGWIAENVGTPGKDLVFADEYTYGNLLPHSYTSLTWSDDSSAIVYIYCGANDDYYVNMYHNGVLDTHDTNYDCDNKTDNDNNNSVWLENANTVATSDWEDEVEGDVKAWSFYEYDTKTTYTYWDSASNTYEDCPSGSGSTTDISSTLGLGGTSVWTVSGIDDC